MKLLKQTFLSTELLAGSDLDNVRVRAMALADYYGQDFNEILNTAANVKEFGISYRSIR
jgi:hypothetical protein